METKHGVKPSVGPNVLLGVSWVVCHDSWWYRSVQVKQGTTKYTNSAKTKPPRAGRIEPKFERAMVGTPW